MFVIYQQKSTLQLAFTPQVAALQSILSSSLSGLSSTFNIFAFTVPHLHFTIHLCVTKQSYFCFISKSLLPFPNIFWLHIFHTDFAHFLFRVRSSSFTHSIKTDFIALSFSDYFLPDPSTIMLRGGLDYHKPFPCPLPVQKRRLKHAESQSLLFLTLIYFTCLWINSPLRVNSVAELSKKVWESEYYWSKAYIVSIAREGHGSPKLNRLTDKASH